MNHFKRRLVAIYGLDLLIGLCYTIVTPFHPGPKDSLYFFYVFVPILSLVFGFFSTIRKYRLPRRYMFNFSLISCLFSMILLSANNLGTQVSQDIILVISKIFMGFGWGAGIFNSITLICSLYPESFQFHLGLFVGFNLLGSIIGLLVIEYGYKTISNLYIILAVIFFFYIPILLKLVGDLSYTITSERYTVMDYLKKSVFFT